MTDLPDGTELTIHRKAVLAKGLDHYTRFHKRERDWMKWCPICRMKQKACEKVEDFR